MICLTKLFQQKRRRIGYILAFSAPKISKRDSSDYITIINKKKDASAHSLKQNCDNADYVLNLKTKSMEKVKKPLLPLMTKQLAVSLLIGGVLCFAPQAHQQLTNSHVRFTM